MKPKKGTKQMKCNKCGSEVNSGSKFCPVCGAPIGQTANPDGVAELRRIVAVAKYQRLMLLSLLARILLGVGMFIIASLSTLWFIAMISSLVLTCMLIWAHSRSVASIILFLVFAWIPIVAIPLMCVHTVRATILLSKNGIKVGFLGAPGSDVQLTKIKAELAEREWTK